MEKAIKNTERNIKPREVPFQRSHDKLTETVWKTKQTTSFKAYSNFSCIFLNSNNSNRPVHKKYDSSKLKNFINEKFKKIFNFFTCILPNNVAHDITKEFWKNSHFENMTAVFFWAVKTDFGKLPLKKSIFRDDKNISSSILPR